MGFENFGDTLGFRDITIPINFIPLTFIAGWYGMNFKYIPELNYPFSYPIIIIITLGCIAGMLFYFRKKKWFGKRK